MVQTILPKTDLEYDDIRDTLNAGGGSVTNTVDTAFKPEAKINKWAKYKPVKYNKDFPTHDEYWKADDGFCGLTPAICGADFITDSQTLKWSYSLPNGSLSQPCRLQDFESYNPDAKPLYMPLYPKEVEENSSFDVLFVESEPDSNSLTFLDIFKSLGGSSQKFYISCVAQVVKNGGSTVLQQVVGSTSEITTGGNLHLTIDTKGSEFKPGNKVNLYIMLSDLPFEHNAIPPSAHKYAYPDSKYYKRSAQVSITARPVFVDRWEIDRWTTVNAQYNYIQFEAHGKPVNGDLNIPSSRTILYSYDILTEYGETWLANRQFFPPDDIQVVADSIKGQFIIKGTVRLPTTVHQNYQGLLTLEWFNGVDRDALGGTNVSWKLG